MIVELNLANIIFLFIAAISAVWGLAKLLMAQYNKAQDVRAMTQDAARKQDYALIAKRMDTSEAVLREEAQQWQRMERELLELKAELPVHYVRREDYIRGQSVIEAKLDGLASRMENIQLRSIMNGGNHAN